MMKDPPRKHDKDGGRGGGGGAQKCPQNRLTSCVHGLTTWELILSWRITAFMKHCVTIYHVWFMCGVCGVGKLNFCQETNRGVKTDTPGTCFGCVPFELNMFLEFIQFLEY